jgi:3-hydroxyisobutyrate dehydrogenase-like beta-hydroxyacid dehydrogenase
MVLMSNVPRLGFIGLGVMGSGMCANLIRKSGAAVRVFDMNDAARQAMIELGAVGCGSVAEVAEAAETIFLSLPGGREVRAVTEEIAGSARPESVVVDLSTTGMADARQVAGGLAANRIAFADAPVARTRQAAIDGTLSIMVGATPQTFSRIEPLLRHMASEVTHCGEAGAGQTVKIMNNMILFQTVVALAEGLSIARANGVDGKVLFETLTKGSADSFALRNHGMKAMLPGVFPERAFSTEYAMKDLSYAIQMAEEVGVPALGADVVRELMERAVELGHGKEYWPVILKAIEDATGK